MIMIYKTKGVCAKEIQFDIENDVVKSVQFIGGCSGNTQGVARLVEGMEVHDAIKRLSGIDCNGRGTSCPDQLSIALRQALEQQA